MRLIRTAAPGIGVTPVELKSRQYPAGTMTLGALGSVVVAADTTRESTRVASLDFVKGTLVLVMVLYHWLNYFVGLEWGGYKYLRFLTPGFVFITGYLISHVYLARFSFDDPGLRRRLWRRG